MSIMNNTPLLVNLSVLTLFLLLQSATSSYPSVPSPSPSPLVESTQSPSPSPAPAQSYSPPAPPISPSHSPAPAPAPAPTNASPSAPVPAPADDAPFIPTPPPEVENESNAESMNHVTKETKKSSSGGNRVGAAFGLIGAACLVVFGGAVYKKRRDNIRRSRRYSAANIQLI